jgi:hypothetical protein
MNGSLDSFDINDLSTADMKLLANIIDEYIMVLEEVMIIPEEIIRDKEEKDEAMKLVKKIIKKLRAGDKSVFNDNNE